MTWLTALLIAWAAAALGLLAGALMCAVGRDAADAIAWMEALLGNDGCWDMLVVEGYPGDELTWVAYVAEDDGYEGERDKPRREIRALGKTRDEAIRNLFEKLREGER